MQELFILGVVGLTSAGAAVIAVRGRQWSGRALGAAITVMLECIGAGLVFFAVNLLAGMSLILTARALTRGHVSLYVVDDVVLLALSLLQGLAFQCWRTSLQPDRGEAR